MEMNDEFVGEFVEFCEYRDKDTAEAARFLAAQDWEAGKEDIIKFSEEQVETMCRLMNQIDGEPTKEQMEAIVRSVIDATSVCTVAR